MLYLTLHTLLVSDLEASVAFYRERLGMQLQRSIQAADTSGERHALLAFPPRAGNIDVPLTRLHLVQRAASTALLSQHGAEDADAEDTAPAGYWKIAVTLADVHAAAVRLRAAGVEVSEPRQFRDIGYLCHFADPDGHTIELLQHTFGACEPSSTDPNGADPDGADPDGEDGSLPLGGPGHFGLITLRVKDPEVSLRYYRDVLGMRLLSRQTVAPYRFTLYFLAFTEETPPLADIDAVENREWLWQRPYTVLELQHRWGSEEGDFRYRVGDDTGFNSFSIAAADAQQAADEFARAGLAITVGAPFAEVFHSDARTTCDPDGYALRIVTAR